MDAVSISIKFFITKYFVARGIKNIFVIKVNIGIFIIIIIIKKKQEFSTGKLFQNHGWINKWRMDRKRWEVGGNFDTWCVVVHDAKREMNDFISISGNILKFIRIILIKFPGIQREQIYLTRADKSNKNETMVKDQAFKNSTLWLLLRSLYALCEICIVYQAWSHVMFVTTLKACGGLFDRQDAADRLVRWINNRLNVN